MLPFIICSVMFIFFLVFYMGGMYSEDTSWKILPTDIFSFQYKWVHISVVWAVWEHMHIKG